MSACRRLLRRLLFSSVLTLLAGGVLMTPAPVLANGEGYAQTNLVSDLAGRANVNDPHLKNPWGIVHGPATPWWVSDNNGHVSTLYDGAGVPRPLVVTIPAPGATSGGAPTGIVFNGSPKDFFVSDAKKNNGSSLFIFATEDGTIAGWSPTVSLPQAFIAVDNSPSGAVYKGLAIAQTEAGQRLYATNFSAGTVDVFDSSFTQVKKAGAFKDSRIPADFAPFGIQTIDDMVYVTYAKQKPDKHDDQSGPHNGFVDVFNTEGKLLKRLIKRGKLNSPWGLAVAPENFGEFSGDLLVGNFGDGRINAYDRRSGEFAGTLRKPDGKPVVIDGLWGIGFGNGSAAGPKNTLFFAAGINEEADGLFGTLTAVGEAENNN
jgi:uncharacterized protein (TIGR03118 family)